MYIIKNALSNIWSSKGRNILIGVIVLVIAASSCVALSVKESASKAETDGLKNLTITGTISYDREKLMKQAQSSGGDVRTMMQSIKELTIDDMLKYAKSSYVKEFRYSVSTTVNATGVDPVEETSSSTSNSASTSSNSNNNNNNNRNFGFGANGDFTITGYSSYNTMSNFVSGASKITDGKIFDVDSTENQCVISDELASYDKLKVGDTLTLVNPNSTSQTFTFKITGIYKNTSSDTSTGMRFSTAQSAANQIYTTYAALNKVITYTTANATTSTDNNGNTHTTALTARTSGTYIFASSDAFSKFKSDVKKLGLSDDYVVSSTDLQNYESSLVPIKNTAKFANTMLLIVLSIGAVILIVLNIFNIRERKYEVGVLTAIGMKKRKVATQFVIELFVVTFIALGIGTAIGAAASVPIANSLLQNQIAAQQSSQQQQTTNFMPGGNASGKGFSGLQGRNQNTKKVNYISKINASTNLTVVGQLMLIGVLLTVVASLSAVIFIMRYEPLKILSERS